MEKIVRIPHVDPIGEYPKLNHGSLLKIDLDTSAQKVPAPGSETVVDHEPIFSPNPDLALP
jgi:hypothetical protein